MINYNRLAGKLKEDLDSVTLLGYMAGYMCFSIF